MVGTEDGEEIKVVDTIKENNLPISVLEKIPSNPSQTFEAKVDQKLRRQTEANHSATHLLHHALREVLGVHVEQKGSYVSDRLLRFDFSHFSKMSLEELRLVELEVNEAIRQNSTREEHRSMPIEEAKKMGAMAFFGEKYGEEVRVIKYGDSIEFCGGTHVPSTGVIGSFRIVSESSIAAGIRRIEAVTGVGADEYYFEQQDKILKVQEMLQNAPNLVKAVKKLIEEDEKLRKELKQAHEQQKHQLVDKLFTSAKSLSGVEVITAQLDAPAGLVKDVAFALKPRLKGREFVVALGSVDNDKPSLTLMLSDELVEKGLNAGQLVREAGKLIQGGGGGQPNFATAGGKDKSGVKRALDKIIESLDL